LPLVVSSHPSFLPDLPVHRSCLLSYSLIFSAACLSRAAKGRPGLRL
jgi:hypothetical protein